MKHPSSYRKLKENHESLGSKILEIESQIKPLKRSMQILIDIESLNYGKFAETKCTLENNIGAVYCQLEGFEKGLLKLK